MADPVNAQTNHHRVQDWIDDEVQDWNAFPEENYVAVPRITRSQRIMNNNQRKQSVLVDEQMPPGNFNDAPDVEHDLRV
ncbi:hypothetical protein OROMI_006667 [Orobanche minor]